MVFVAPPAPAKKTIGHPMLPLSEKQRRLDRALEFAAQLRLGDDDVANLRTLWTYTFRFWLWTWTSHRRGNAFSVSGPFYAAFIFVLHLFWILLSPKLKPQTRVKRWLLKLDSLYDDDQYSQYFKYAVIADYSPLPLPDTRGLPADEADIVLAKWDLDRRNPIYFPKDPDWLPKNNYKNDPRNQKEASINSSPTSYHPIPGEGRRAGAGEGGAPPKTRLDHLLKLLTLFTNRPNLPSENTQPCGAPPASPRTGRTEGGRTGRTDGARFSPRFSESVRWCVGDFLVPVVSLCSLPESKHADDIAGSQIRAMEKTVHDLLPDLANLPIHELDYITPIPRPLAKSRRRSRAPP